MGAQGRVCLNWKIFRCLKRDFFGSGTDVLCRDVAMIFFPWSGGVFFRNGSFI